MKNILTFLALIVFCCVHAQTDKAAINTTLDQWHQAAGDAKFDNYFSYMAADAIFIGTDAGENWNLEQFKVFSRPYFDKGKAWSFKPLQRNIYFNAAKDLAWFDELLETQMKICRGSGVLRKEKGQWKIVHYVLSMTVPNDVVESVVKIKTPLEDEFLKTLPSK